MKKYLVTVIAVSALAICAVMLRSHAQNAVPQLADNSGAGMSGAVATTNNEESASVFVTEIPAGYRDWKFISLAREEGKLDDIRAILGNDIAIKAYRDGTRPFPEGSMIARLAYSCVASDDNNKIFGRTQSFVAGAPKNGIQFMIKDSKKYASTGGWGYGQFDDGRFVGAAMLTSCFPCHQAFKDHDFVFTHYAP